MLTLTGYHLILLSILAGVCTALVYGWKVGVLAAIVTFVIFLLITHPVGRSW